MIAAFKGMGLLCPIILILLSTVDRLGYQLTMRYTANKTDGCIVRARQSNHYNEINLCR